jgi:hypothetical protein
MVWTKKKIAIIFKIMLIVLKIISIILENDADDIPEDI